MALGFTAMSSEQRQYVRWMSNASETELAFGFITSDAPCKRQHLLAVCPRSRFLSASEWTEETKPRTEVLVD